MIRVTQLKGKTFFLNCDVIQYIDSTPDTVITLTTGEKWMVQEDADTIIERIIDYKKRIYQGQLIRESLSSELRQKVPTSDVKGDE